LDPAANASVESAVKRLQAGAKEIGVQLKSVGRKPGASPAPGISASKSKLSPALPEAHRISISASGVQVEYSGIEGFHAAVATLRQIFREHGRRLPCLRIHDWPDFPRRGVMLDVSRGRVPRLETLLELVDHLADFKINEFQLYTEHTFAYRTYKPVWQGWGALTAGDIQRLYGRCRELGIDLVPNQNSFGHLRYFLEHPRVKPLAEVNRPYEDASGEFVRRPSTLAPNHPGTLRFLSELYDELLPNFCSRFFNVGCDETWDLGRGQSDELCRRKGKGRVYLEFLKKVQREVSARGRQMMFWGDIILNHPELIRELPKNVIALNWGYEANHPFERETKLFAKSKIPFYVCPGTSTWMTLIGRHDNALANLRRAADAGRKHSAIGYLITDWGDGGHPQPLAISYVPYLAGAALSWCADSFDDSRLPSSQTRNTQYETRLPALLHILSRDVFHDPTGRIAKAAFTLGLAHRKLNYTEPNATPLGAVIAAPRPEDRELFCRHGLKYYSRLKSADIRSALREIEKNRAEISRALNTRRSHQAKVLVRELDLAARMAAQSCKFMLWQKAVAAGKTSLARSLAKKGIRELQKLEKEFNACWPLRNKATTKKCSPFLNWRMGDYRRSRLTD